MLADVEPGTADEKTLSALSAAVLRLLRPLVRTLLRYGVSYGAFTDLAKRAYIEVADRDFRIPGRKQTTSRVSVLTGLSRKEVRRVRELRMPSARGETQRYNRAARVLGGWLRDPHFHDSEGEPRALDVDGDFGELCRRYSGDVPAKAVLAELTRTGAVLIGDDGRVAMAERAFVPSAAEIDKLAILGTDVGDLAASIGHNIEAPAADAFFQRKVSYDNLPAEAAPLLRKLIRERGQKLLERFDADMAPLDRDLNPDAEGTGRKRIVVGVYYFEADHDEEADDESNE